MRKLLAALCAAGLAGTAGGAGAMSVEFTGTSTAVATSLNDFVDDYVGIFGAGQVGFLTSAQLTAIGTTTLRFTEVGAESGFNNLFEFNNSAIMSESADFADCGDAGGCDFLAGESVVRDFTSTDTLGFDSSGGTDANEGAFGFGLFYDTGKFTGTGTFTAHVGDFFYLAYDDQTGNPDDDNHDDYVVRVDVVPLPPAALLLGSALVGLGVLRRRKAA